MSTLDHLVMTKIAKKPVWMRSLGRAGPPIVRRLIATGLAERCAPDGGTGQNMVRLTPRAYARLGIDPPIQTKLDHFAELLSEHGDVNKVADELGITHTYGRVLLQRLIKAVGPQAC